MKLVSTRWEYHFPGMIYTGTMYFDKPVTQKEARAHLRYEIEQQRLPRYTALWPFDPVSAEIVTKSNRSGNNYVDIMML